MFAHFIIARSQYANGKLSSTEIYGEKKLMQRSLILLLYVFLNIGKCIHKIHIHI